MCDNDREMFFFAFVQRVGRINSSAHQANVCIRLTNATATVTAETAAMKLTAVS